jgi:hypothetical protein
MGGFIGTLIKKNVNAKISTSNILRVQKWLYITTFIN